MDAHFIQLAFGTHDISARERLTLEPVSLQGGAGLDAIKTTMGSLDGNALRELRAWIELRLIAGESPSEVENEFRLSGREEHVLRQIAWGYSNKEIAARMKVSVKTIETYKARAAGKLKLRNRVQIIRYAVQHGWFDFGSSDERA